MHKIKYAPPHDRAGVCVCGGGVLFLTQALGNWNSHEGDRVVVVVVVIDSSLIFYFSADVFFGPEDVGRVRKVSGRWQAAGK